MDIQLLADLLRPPAADGEDDEVCVYNNYTVCVCVTCCDHPSLIKGGHLPMLILAP